MMNLLNGGRSRRGLAKPSRRVLRILNKLTSHFVLQFFRLFYLNKGNILFCQKFGGRCFFCLEEFRVKYHSLEDRFHSFPECNSTRPSLQTLECPAEDSSTRHQFVNYLALVLVSAPIRGSDVAQLVDLVPL